MGFSKTPKANIIFDHAADEQDMFGSLGKKIEDPLKIIYQYRMKINKILRQMQGRFPCQMRVLNIYEWINNHSQVLGQINTVQNHTSQKWQRPEVTLDKVREK